MTKESENMEGAIDAADEFVRNDLVKKLTPILMGVLEDQFGADISALVGPILPALLYLAANEGTAAAEALIVDLATGDTYPSWKRIIEASDPETRIKIMRETEQLAIQDAVKKMRQQKERWEIAKWALSILGSVLLALL